MTQSHSNAKQADVASRHSWLTREKRPIVIAGPCSAETQDQVRQTATQLFRTGKVDILRAGIWKPRTRPDSFEGVGAKGLPWLQEVRSLTGMSVTVEVAKASHVELCLNFEIDMLWIGARTTVNPFAVQEIAEALRGVDIPILVKNPINPDLSLWLGAIQRFQKVGIREIGAIHRGFSNYGEKIYRNRPQWQIPIAFKRHMPDIPILCDPSHICGNRHMLQDVAQKSMDLDFDGLMIESHVTPDDAWSDANQQITPADFKALIEGLVLRHDFEEDRPVQGTLDRLRQEIDHIDDELVHLLANRMKVAREIGTYKKDNLITILQQKRWNEIIDKSVQQARKNGLSEAFILKLIRAIHDESIDQQERVMKD